ncbi:hypothetical protein DPMN_090916 [Dreissena polymorpha]|uniref:Uncharacterized protein n=1 Tax=Dreissena polymorpha TaxID=45954 RepID=A0A9D4QYR6_DREPO|nr:hypothetical protein DPMN_090916 [Dreissena polymorpha]
MHSVQEKALANSADPVETPRDAASHQGLRCLLKGISVPLREVELRQALSTTYICDALTSVRSASSPEYHVELNQAPCTSAKLYAPRVYKTLTSIGKRYGRTFQFKQLGKRVVVLRTASIVHTAFENVHFDDRKQPFLQKYILNNSGFAFADYKSYVPELRALFKRARGPTRPGPKGYPFLGIFLQLMPFNVLHKTLTSIGKRYGRLEPLIPGFLE